MTPYALTKKIRALSPVTAQLQLEMVLSKTRGDAFEEAAKECDALGRMAPNQERGLAYDIAAKCIRELVLANKV